jgi:hypothetical protein
VDVLFMLALAAVAILPWLTPVPTVVCVVGIAAIVPFFAVHCAEPALRAVGAPTGMINLVRASVALCVLMAALYATIYIVWALTGTVLVGGAGSPLRLAEAAFTMPVLLSFFLPVVVISVRPQILRRGRGAELRTDTNRDPGR